MMMRYAAVVLAVFLSVGGLKIALAQEGVQATAVATHVLTKILPVYPPEVQERKVSGVVTISAVIDKNGAVKELAATSGPIELRTEALRAVAYWTFRPAVLNGHPVETQRTIRVAFVLDDAANADLSGVDLVVGTKQSAPMLTKVDTPPLPPNTLRISPAQAQKLVQKRVDPVYPPAAKAAGVTGNVLVSVLIDKTGQAIEIKPILGPEMFRDAAADCIRHWIFSPYVLNGEAREVSTAFSVQFQ